MSDIWSIIFQKLSLRDRFRCKSVCKLWNSLLPQRIKYFSDLIGRYVVGIRYMDHEGSLLAEKLYCNCEMDRANRRIFFGPTALNEIYNETLVRLAIYIRDKDVDSILAPLRVVLLISDNHKNVYSSSTNWRLFETIHMPSSIDSNFKYIGYPISKIDSVYSLEVSNLEEVEIPVTIHMGTRIIKLSVSSIDDYYPETLWDLI